MTDAELDHIAVGLTQSSEARESQSYLYLLGLIWQKADQTNRVDLRLAMLSAVEKYDLARLLNYEYGKDMGGGWWEECENSDILPSREMQQRVLGIIDGL